MRYTMRVADRYGEHGVGVEVNTDNLILACRVAEAVTKEYPSSIVMIDDDNDEEKHINWSEEVFDAV